MVMENLDSRPSSICCQDSRMELHPLASPSSDAGKRQVPHASFSIARLCTDLILVLERYCTLRTYRLWRLCMNRLLCHKRGSIRHRL